MRRLRRYLAESVTLTLVLGVGLFPVTSLWGFSSDLATTWARWPYALPAWLAYYSMGWALIIWQRRLFLRWAADSLTSCEDAEFAGALFGCGRGILGRRLRRIALQAFAQRILSQSPAEWQPVLAKRPDMLPLLLFGDDPDGVLAGSIAVAAGTRSDSTAKWLGRLSRRQGRAGAPALMNAREAARAHIAESLLMARRAEQDPRVPYSDDAVSGLLRAGAASEAEIHGLLRAGATESEPPEVPWEREC